MSYDVQFDEGEYGGQLATSGGMGDFRKWVSTLDGVDALRHFVEYGWSDQLAELTDELHDAIINGEPDDSVASTASGFLELLKSRPDDSETVVIDDGSGSVGDDGEAELSDPLILAWSGDLHPRNKSGQFVSKGTLATAAGNVKSAELIREQISPADLPDYDAKMKQIHGDAYKTPAAAPSIRDRVIKTIVSPVFDPETRDKLQGWAEAVTGGATKPVKIVANRPDTSKMTKIGEGSARRVFEDGDTVVKEAKNRQAKNDNKIEMAISTKHPLFAKVIEGAKDGSWLRQEKLAPAADADMARTYGVSQKDAEKVYAIPIMDAFGQSNKIKGNWMVASAWAASGTPRAEGLGKSADKFINDLKSVRAAAPGVDVTDLGYSNQWGRGADGRPKIVDFSFAKSLADPISLADVPIPHQGFNVPSAESVLADGMREFDRLFDALVNAMAHRATKATLNGIRKQIVELEATLRTSARVLGMLSPWQPRVNTYADAAAKRVAEPLRLDDEIHGDSVPWMLSWDATQHPRDEHGQFINVPGEFVKSATDNSWSNKVIEQKAAKEGIDPKEAIRGVRAAKKQMDKERADTSRNAATAKPAKDWTKEEIKAVHESGGDVPDDAWAANYDYANQVGKREVAAETIKKWESANPKPQQIQDSIVKQAEDSGLKVSGLDYVSPGGSRYITVINPKTNETQEFRISSHGGRLAPTDADINTQTHPDVVKRKIDLMVQAVAGMAGRSLSMPVTLADKKFSATKRGKFFFPWIRAAIDFLQSKSVISSKKFAAMAEADRVHVFSAPGINSTARLKTLQKKLGKSLKLGEDLRTFRKAIEADVSLTRAQTETMYRTETKRGYVAGFDQAMCSPLVAEEFPYVMTTATPDQRVRDTHWDVDGYVFAKSDTRSYNLLKRLWQDYGCRCSAIPLSEFDAQERGIKTWDDIPVEVRKKYG